MKFAIVTGSSGGIGRELVKYFKDHDYCVLGIDKKKDSKFLGHDFCLFDFERIHSDQASLNKFFKKAFSKKVESLHLVNNAATQVTSSFKNFRVEDWNRTLTVNVTTPLILSKLLYPYFLKTQDSSILNIASVHAKLTKPNFFMYATSKCSLLGLTKSLALELAPKIRVNSISPGAVETPMLRAGLSKLQYTQLKKVIPNYQIYSPQEIAKIALFLMESKHTTGTDFSIDGAISSRLHDPG